MAGLAETAKLVSSLELKDNFTPAANKAMKSLGRLESTSFRVGQQIGKGFNNAAKNLKRIAEVGVVALAGAITLGIRSLGDLARTQAQTNAVITSTKGAAKVTAAEVRSMAESLENLTTVDDKVIQDGENMLLTFTNISGKVFPQATKAALDMAVAMAGGNVEAVDLKASSIQLGKALNDPIKGIGALSKVGVTFTEKQKKLIKQLVKTGDVVGAQKVILAELNKEFGKAGEAAGTGPEAVMRRLKDAGEDLSQVLARGVLPVLERFAKFLTAKLADPVFLAQVDEFGRNLGIAGGKFLDFLEKVDFKAIGAALQAGAGFAGQIIDAFLKAPTWLQEAIVTGWGLNKLTGGAVSGIFGELASGLIKGVLGMNAGVVHLTAGTVIGGGGGVPGVPEAVGAAGVGALATASIISLAVIGSVAGFLNTYHGPKANGAFTPTVTSANVVQRVKVEDFKGIDWGTIARNLGGKTNQSGSPDDRQARNDLLNRVDNTTTAVETMKGNIAKDLAGNQTAIDNAGRLGAAAAQGAGNVAARAATTAGYVVANAVRSSQPIVNTDVRVYVSAAGVTKSVTEQSRYGPGNGSAGSTGGMLNDRER